MPFFLEKNKVLFNTALMLFVGSRVFSLNFSLYYTDLSKMPLFNCSDFKLPFRLGVLLNTLYAL